MAEIANPHDRFFREVFSRLEWSRDFLRTQLPPAIVETLALETLDLRPGSFLDQELQQYYSDLLFRVTLKTGRDAFVYVLLEHKSYVERFVALQLLRYQIEIWEQVRSESQQRSKLPPIYPLVVYHGRRKWTAAQQFAELIDSEQAWQPFIPDFYYAVASVAEIRETELFESVLFRAAIRLMRHIFDPDLVEKLPEIWAEFHHLAWGPETQGFLIVMLSYVSSATSVSNTELVQTLEAAVPEQEDTLMTTLAQQWLEQGIEQGIEQGRQVVLDSLRFGLVTRFGVEAEGMMSEISAVRDIGKLKQLLQSLFEVNTITEFQQRYRSVISDHPVQPRTHSN